MLQGKTDQASLAQRAYGGIVYTCIITKSWCIFPETVERKKSVAPSSLEHSLEFSCIVSEHDSSPSPAVTVDTTRWQPRPASPEPILSPSDAASSPGLVTAVMRALSPVGSTDCPPQPRLLDNSQLEPSKLTPSEPYRSHSLQSPRCDSLELSA